MNAPPSESDTQPTPPKLLDQVRHKLRLKHHAASTEKQYVSWIRRFILFHEKRHPRELGRKDVERFLTHLAVDRHVASSTQNQALAALLFLYRDVLEQPFGWLEDVVRAKKPKRLPVVFSKPEAEAVLLQLHGIPWLMAMLLYGSGLRLKECLRLRRHPYRPGTAGTPRRSHHPNLYARSRYQPGRRPQSRRLALGSELNRRGQPIPKMTSVSPSSSALFGLHSVPLGDTVRDANCFAALPDTPPSICT